MTRGGSNSPDKEGAQQSEDSSKPDNQHSVEKSGTAQPHSQPRQSNDGTEPFPQGASGECTTPAPSGDTRQSETQQSNDGNEPFTQDSRGECTALPPCGNTPQYETQRSDDRDKALTQNSSRERATASPVGDTRQSETQQSDYGTEPLTQESRVGNTPYSQPRQSKDGTKSLSQGSGGECTTPPPSGDTRQSETKQSNDGTEPLTQDSNDECATPPSFRETPQSETQWLGDGTKPLPQDTSGECTILPPHGYKPQSEKQQSVDGTKPLLQDTSGECTSLPPHGYKPQSETQQSVDGTKPLPQDTSGECTILPPCGNTPQYETQRSDDRDKPLTQNSSRERATASPVGDTRQSETQQSDDGTEPLTQDSNDECGTPPPVGDTPQSETQWLGDEKKPFTQDFNDECAKPQSVRAAPQSKTQQSSDGTESLTQYSSSECTTLPPVGVTPQSQTQQSDDKTKPLTQDSSSEFAIPSPCGDTPHSDTLRSNNGNEPFTQGSRGECTTPSPVGDTSQSDTLQSTDGNGPLTQDFHGESAMASPCGDRPQSETQQSNNGTKPLKQGGSDECTTLSPVGDTPRSQTLRSTDENEPLTQDSRGVCTALPPCGNTPESQTRRSNDENELLTQDSNGERANASPCGDRPQSETQRSNNGNEPFTQDSNDECDTAPPVRDTPQSETQQSDHVNEPQTQDLSSECTTASLRGDTRQSETQRADNGNEPFTQVSNDECTNPQSVRDAPQSETQQSSDGTPPLTQDSSGECATPSPCGDTPLFKTQRSNDGIEPLTEDLGGECATPTPRGDTPHCDTLRSTDENEPQTQDSSSECTTASLRGATCQSETQRANNRNEPLIQVSIGECATRPPVRDTPKSETQQSDDGGEPLPRVREIEDIGVEHVKPRLLCGTEDNGILHATSHSLRGTEDNGIEHATSPLQHGAKDTDIEHATSSSLCSIEDNNIRHATRASLCETGDIGIEYVTSPLCGLEDTGDEHTTTPTLSSTDDTGIEYTTPPTLCGTDDTGIEYTTPPTLCGTDDTGIEYSTPPTLCGTDDTGIEYTTPPTLGGTDDTGIEYTTPPTLCGTFDTGIEHTTAPSLSSADDTGIEQATPVKSCSSGDTVIAQTKSPSPRGNLYHVVEHNKSPSSCGNEDIETAHTSPLTIRDIEDTDFSLRDLSESNHAALDRTECREQVQVLETVGRSASLQNGEDAKSMTYQLDYRHNDIHSNSSRSQTRELHVVIYNLTNNPPIDDITSASTDSPALGDIHYSLTENPAIQGVVHTVANNPAIQEDAADNPAIDDIACSPAHNPAIGNVVYSQAKNPTIEGVNSATNIRAIEDFVSILHDDPPIENVVYSLAENPAIEGVYSAADRRAIEGVVHILADNPTQEDNVYSLSENSVVEGAADIPAMEDIVCSLAENPAKESVYSAADNPAIEDIVCSMADNPTREDNVYSQSENSAVEGAAGYRAIEDFVSSLADDPPFENVVFSLAENPAIEGVYSAADRRAIEGIVFSMNDNPAIESSSHPSRDSLRFPVITDLSSNSDACDDYIKKILDLLLPQSATSFSTTKTETSKLTENTKFMVGEPKGRNEKSHRKFPEASTIARSSDKSTSSKIKHSNTPAKEVFRHSAPRERASDSSCSDRHLNFSEFEQELSQRVGSGSTPEKHLESLPKESTYSSDRNNRHQSQVKDDAKSHKRASSNATLPRDGNFGTAQEITSVTAKARKIIRAKRTRKKQSVSSQDQTNPSEVSNATSQRQHGLTQQQDISSPYTARGIVNQENEGNVIDSKGDSPSSSEKGRKSHNTCSPCSSPKYESDVSSATARQNEMRCEFPNYSSRKQRGRANQESGDADPPSCETSKPPSHEPHIIGSSSHSPKLEGYRTPERDNINTSEDMTTYEFLYELKEILGPQIGVDMLREAYVAARRRVNARLRTDNVSLEQTHDRSPRPEGLVTPPKQHEGLSPNDSLSPTNEESFSPHCVGERLLTSVDEEIESAPPESEMQNRPRSPSPRTPPPPPPPPPRRNAGDESDDSAVPHADDFPFLDEECLSSPERDGNMPPRREVSPMMEGLFPLPDPAYVAQRPPLRQPPPRRPRRQQQPQPPPPPPPPQIVRNSAERAAGFFQEREVNASTESGANNSAKHGNLPTNGDDNGSVQRKDNASSLSTGNASTQTGVCFPPQDRSTVLQQSPQREAIVLPERELGLSLQEVNTSLEKETSLSQQNVTSDPTTREAIVSLQGEASVSPLTRTKFLQEREGSVLPETDASVSSKNGANVSPRRESSVSPQREYSMSPLKEDSLSPERVGSVLSKREGSVSPERQASISSEWETITSSTKSASASLQREDSVSPEVEGSVSPQREYEVLVQREGSVSQYRTNSVSPERENCGLPENEDSASPKKEPNVSLDRECSASSQNEHRMSTKRETSNSPHRKIGVSRKRKASDSSKSEASVSSQSDGSVSPERKINVSKGRETSISPQRKINVSRKRKASDSSESEGSVSPEREGSVSPERRGSVSPQREGSVSPEREGSVSPGREGSVSLERKVNVSPERQRCVSAEKEGSVSPEREGNVSPERRHNVSPERQGNVSPEREGNVSPERRHSVSPEREGSVSPLKEKSSVPLKKPWVPKEPVSILKRERCSSSQTEISSPHGIIDILQRENTSTSQTEGIVSPQIEASVSPQIEASVSPQIEASVSPQSGGNIYQQGDRNVLVQKENDAPPRRDSTKAYFQAPNQQENSWPQGKGSFPTQRYTVKTPPKEEEENEERNKRMDEHFSPNKDVAPSEKESNLSSQENYAKAGKEDGVSPTKQSLDPQQEKETGSPKEDGMASPLPDDTIQLNSEGLDHDIAETNEQQKIKPNWDESSSNQRMAKKTISSSVDTVDRNRQKHGQNVDKSLTKEAVASTTNEQENVSLRSDEARSVNMNLGPSLSDRVAENTQRLPKIETLLKDKGKNIKDLVQDTSEPKAMWSDPSRMEQPEVKSSRISGVSFPRFVTAEQPDIFSPTLERQHPQQYREVEITQTLNVSIAQTNESTAPTRPETAQEINQMPSHEQQTDSQSTSASNTASGSMHSSNSVSPNDTQGDYRLETLGGVKPESTNHSSVAAGQYTATAAGSPEYDPDDDNRKSKKKKKKKKKKAKSRPNVEDSPRRIGAVEGRDQATKRDPKWEDWSQRTAENMDNDQEATGSDETSEDEEYERIKDELIQIEVALQIENKMLQKEILRGYSIEKGSPDEKQQFLRQKLKERTKAKEDKSGKNMDLLDSNVKENVPNESKETEGPTEQEKVDWSEQQIRYFRPKADGSGMEEINRQQEEAYWRHEAQQGSGYQNKQSELKDKETLHAEQRKTDMPPPVAASKKKKRGKTVDVVDADLPPCIHRSFPSTATYVSKGRAGKTQKKGKKKAYGSTADDDDFEETLRQFQEGLKECGKCAICLGLADERLNQRFREFVRKKNMTREEIEDIIQAAQIKIKKERSKEERKNKIKKHSGTLVKQGVTTDEERTVFDTRRQQNLNSEDDVNMVLLEEQIEEEREKRALEKTLNKEVEEGIRAVKEKIVRGEIPTTQDKVRVQAQNLHEHEGDALQEGLDANSGKNRKANVIGLEEKIDSGSLETACRVERASDFEKVSVQLGAKDDNILAAKPPCQRDLSFKDLIGAPFYYGGNQPQHPACKQQGSRLVSQRSQEHQRKTAGDECLEIKKVSVDATDLHASSLSSEEGGIDNAGFTLLEKSEAVESHKTYAAGHATENEWISNLVHAPGSRTLPPSQDITVASNTRTELGEGDGQPNGSSSATPSNLFPTSQVENNSILEKTDGDGRESPDEAVAFAGNNSAQHLTRHTGMYGEPPREFDELAETGLSHLTRPQGFPQTGDAVRLFDVYLPSESQKISLDSVNNIFYIPQDWLDSSNPRVQTHLFLVKHRGFRFRWFSGYPVFPPPLAEPDLHPQACSHANVVTSKKSEEERGLSPIGDRPGIPAKSTSSRSRDVAEKGDENSKNDGEPIDSKDVKNIANQEQLPRSSNQGGSLARPHNNDKGVESKVLLPKSDERNRQPLLPTPDIYGLISNNQSETSRRQPTNQDNKNETSALYEIPEEADVIRKGQNESQEARDYFSKTEFSKTAEDASFSLVVPATPKADDSPALPIESAQLELIPSATLTSKTSGRKHKSRREKRYKMAYPVDKIGDNLPTYSSSSVSKKNKTNSKKSSSNKNSDNNALEQPRDVTHSVAEEQEDEGKSKEESVNGNRKRKTSGRNTENTPEQIKKDDITQKEKGGGKNDDVTSPKHDQKDVVDTNSRMISHETVDNNDKRDDVKIETKTSTKDEDNEPEQIGKNINSSVGPEDSVCTENRDDTFIALESQNVLDSFKEREDGELSNRVKKDKVKKKTVRQKKREKKIMKAQAAAQFAAAKLKNEQEKEKIMQDRQIKAIAEKSVREDPKKFDKVKTESNDRIVNSSVNIKREEEIYNVNQVPEVEIGEERESRNNVDSRNRIENRQNVAQVTIEKLNRLDEKSESLTSRNDVKTQDIAQGSPKVDEDQRDEQTESAESGEIAKEDESESSKSYEPNTRKRERSRYFFRTPATKVSNLTDSRKFYTSSPKEDTAPERPDAIQTGLIEKESSSKKGATSEDSKVLSKCSPKHITATDSAEGKYKGSPRQKTTSRCSKVSRVRQISRRAAVFLGIIEDLGNILRDLQISSDMHPNMVQNMLSKNMSGDYSGKIPGYNTEGVAPPPNPVGKHCGKWLEGREAFVPDDNECQDNGKGKVAASKLARTLALILDDEEVKIPYGDEMGESSSDNNDDRRPPKDGDRDSSSGEREFSSGDNGGFGAGDENLDRGTRDSGKATGDSSGGSGSSGDNQPLNSLNASSGDGDKGASSEGRDQPASSTTSNPGKTPFCREPDATTSQISKEDEGQMKYVIKDSVTSTPPTEVQSSLVEETRQKETFEENRSNINLSKDNQLSSCSEKQTSAKNLNDCHEPKDLYAKKQALKPFKGGQYGNLKRQRKERWDHPVYRHQISHNKARRDYQIERNFNSRREFQNEQRRGSQMERNSESESKERRDSQIDIESQSQSEEKRDSQIDIESKSRSKEKRDPQIDRESKSQSKERRESRIDTDSKNHNTERKDSPPSNKTRLKSNSRETARSLERKIILDLFDGPESGTSRSAKDSHTSDNKPTRPPFISVAKNKNLASSVLKVDKVIPKQPNLSTMNESKTSNPIPKAEAAKSLKSELINKCSVDEKSVVKTEPREEGSKALELKKAQSRIEKEQSSRGVKEETQKELNPVGKEVTSMKSIGDIEIKTKCVSKTKCLAVESNVGENSITQFQLPSFHSAFGKYRDKIKLQNQGNTSPPDTFRSETSSLNDFSFVFNSRAHQKQRIGGGKPAKQIAKPKPGRLSPPMPMPSFPLKPLTPGSSELTQSIHTALDHYNYKFHSVAPLPIEEIKTTLKDAVKMYGPDVERSSDDTTPLEKQRKKDCLEKTDSSSKPQGAETVTQTLGSQSCLSISSDKTEIIASTKEANKAVPYGKVKSNSCKPSERNPIITVGEKDKAKVTVPNDAITIIDQSSDIVSMSSVRNDDKSKDSFTGSKPSDEISLDTEEVIFFSGIIQVSGVFKADDIAQGIKDKDEISTAGIVSSDSMAPKDVNVTDICTFEASKFRNECIKAGDHPHNITNSYRHKTRETITDDLFVRIRETESVFQNDDSPEIPLMWEEGTGTQGTNVWQESSMNHFSNMSRETIVESPSPPNETTNGSDILNPSLAEYDPALPVESGDNLPMFNLRGDMRPPLHRLSESLEKTKGEAMLNSDSVFPNSSHQNRPECYLMSPSPRAARKLSFLGLTGEFMTPEGASPNRSTYHTPSEYCSSDTVFATPTGSTSTPKTVTVEPNACHSSAGTSQKDSEVTTPRDLVKQLEFQGTKEMPGLLQKRTFLPIPPQDVSAKKFKLPSFDSVFGKYRDAIQLQNQQNIITSNTFRPSSSLLKNNSSVGSLETQQKQRTDSGKLAKQINEPKLERSSPPMPMPSFPPKPLTPSSSELTQSIHTALDHYNFQFQSVAPLPIEAIKTTVKYAAKMYGPDVERSSDFSNPLEERKKVFNLERTNSLSKPQSTENKTQKLDSTNGVPQNKLKYNSYKPIEENSITTVSETDKANVTMPVDAITSIDQAADMIPTPSVKNGDKSKDSFTGSKPSDEISLDTEEVIFFSGIIQVSGVFKADDITQDFKDKDETSTARTVSSDSMAPKDVNVTDICTFEASKFRNECIEADDHPHYVTNSYRHKTRETIADDLIVRTTETNSDFQYGDSPEIPLMREEGTGTQGTNVWQESSVNHLSNMSREMIVESPTVPNETVTHSDILSTSTPESNPASPVEGSGNLLKTPQDFINPLKLLWDTRETPDSLRKRRFSLLSPDVSSKARVSHFLSDTASPVSPTPSYGSDLEHEAIETSPMASSPHKHDQESPPGLSLEDTSLFTSHVFLGENESGKLECSPQQSSSASCIETDGRDKKTPITVATSKLIAKQHLERPEAPLMWDYLNSPQYTNIFQQFQENFPNKIFAETPSPQNETTTGSDILNPSMDEYDPALPIEGGDNPPMFNTPGDLEPSLHCLPESLEEKQLKATPNSGSVFLKASNEDRPECYLMSPFPIAERKLSCPRLTEVFMTPEGASPNKSTYHTPSESWSSDTVLATPIVSTGTPKTVKSRACQSSDGISQKDSELTSLRDLTKPLNLHDAKATPELLKKQKFLPMSSDGCCEKTKVSPFLLHHPSTASPTPSLEPNLEVKAFASSQSASPLQNDSQESSAGPCVRNTPLSFSHAFLDKNESGDPVVSPMQSSPESCFEKDPTDQGIPTTFAKSKLLWCVLKSEKARHKKSTFWHIRKLALGTEGRFAKKYTSVVIPKLAWLKQVRSHHYHKDAKDNMTSTFKVPLCSKSQTRLNTKQVQRLASLLSSILSGSYSNYNYLNREMNAGQVPELCGAFNDTDPDTNLFYYNIYVSAFHSLFETAKPSAQNFNLASDTKTDILESSQILSGSNTQTQSTESLVISEAYYPYLYSEKSPIASTPSDPINLLASKEHSSCEGDGLRKNAQFQESPLMATPQIQPYATKAKKSEKANQPTRQDDASATQPSRLSGNTPFSSRLQSSPMKTNSQDNLKGSSKPDCRSKDVLENDAFINSIYIPEVMRRANDIFVRSGRLSPDTLIEKASELASIYESIRPATSERERIEIESVSVMVHDLRKLAVDALCSQYILTSNMKADTKGYGTCTSSAPSINKAIPRVDGPKASIVTSKHIPSRTEDGKLVPVVTTLAESYPGQVDENLQQELICAALLAQQAVYRQGTASEAVLSVATTTAATNTIAENTTPSQVDASAAALAAAMTNPLPAFPSDRQVDLSPQQTFTILRAVREAVQVDLDKMCRFRGLGCVRCNNTGYTPDGMPCIDDDDSRSQTGSSDSMSSGHFTASTPEEIKLLIQKEIKENESRLINQTGIFVIYPEDQELRQLINAKRQKINFPAATAVEQWEDLDSKIVLKLDSLIGDSTLEHKLAAFGDIVYQTSLETFGAKQYQSKGPPKRSRRQCKMNKLRKQKRNLKKQILVANSEEKKGLQEIWQHLKARHSALSRAESARKKHSQKRKNQERFLRDPFQFARQLFQQPKSGTLAVSREDLEAHLKKSYSDTNQELPLEEAAGLIWPAAPGIKFNNKPPNLQEVVAVVNKARAKSAPGPNGVPYLLYKRCPNVLKRLHKILRSA
ncbi:reverse transcriptase [Elysia marginata]|uniref:Reverse transcriptase n=1 Tax=Elysia marginata TaxID=1093978 RepID=A0AAV4GHP7_9GAST|nr:reverse transcriptase [Elysia marginata]